MRNVMVFFILITIIILIVSIPLIMSRKFRNKGSLIALTNFIVFGYLVYAVDQSDFANSSFSTHADYNEARRLGATNPEELVKRRAEAVAEDEARNAACRQNLVCWADRHSLTASAQCRIPIERSARLNSRWTDGIFSTPMFSSLRWASRNSGVVTYLGDAIEMQNGFGAWIVHNYECEFDTIRSAVRRTTVRAGRL